MVQDSPSRRGSQSYNPLIGYYIPGSIKNEDDILSIAATKAGRF